MDSQEGDLGTYFLKMNSTPVHMAPQNGSIWKSEALGTSMAAALLDSASCGRNLPSVKEELRCKRRCREGEVMGAVNHDGSKSKLAGKAPVRHC